MGQARVGHDKARCRADCDALIVAIHRSTLPDHSRLIDTGLIGTGPDAAGSDEIAAMAAVANRAYHRQVISHDLHALGFDAPDLDSLVNLSLIHI